MMAEEEKLVYWAPEQLPREWAEKALDSGDPDAIASALVRLTYNDSDWRCVYEQCERFVSHPNANVRRNVAICFEMLARFHEAPEIRAAIPLLEELSRDSDALVAVEAQGAIEGILLVFRPRGPE